MIYTKFQFFENLSGSNSRNRREIRAVIDTFEIYTINSLMKKNCESNFIVFRALFCVAQPKQKKSNVLFADFVEMATFLACNFYFNFFSKISLYSNLFFNIFFHQLIEKNHFTRAIPLVRIRPYVRILLQILQIRTDLILYGITLGKLLCVT